MTRDPNATLLDDADRCVKCGLCLPHCPTYGLSQDEGDSPRGRIALMQGLASNALPMTTAAERHLDGCLSCRACEAVCPAEVPYGRMIDAARTWQGQARPARLRQHRLMGAVLTRRWPRRVLGAMLRLAQALGLLALARRMPLPGRLQRLASLVPPLRTAPRPALATAAGSRGRVGLFTGCVSSMTERQALDDSRHVLRARGYTVVTPAAQGCCGALASHNGLPARADRQAEANIKAFDTDLDAIVGTASGCTANLVEYGHQLGTPEAAAFAARSRNVEQFVADADWPDALRLDHTPVTVAVHTPCTLRNVLRDADAALRLLRRLPGVTVVELAGNTRCCGAAGSHLVTRPDAADALVAPKADSAEAIAPDYVVSSNVGCAMHLGGALRRRGAAIPVTHAISIMAARIRS